MPANPRFLLAKYIPDLRRCEPVNIGVMLWVPPDRTACRFLTPRQAGKIVKELDCYKQWLDFWSINLAKPELNYRREKKIVLRTTPQFFDAMLENSKGNYVLADAGEIWEKVKLSHIDGCLDQLFNELVL